MSLLAIVFNILRAFLKSKVDMAAENLCLCWGPANLGGKHSVNPIQTNQLTGKREKTCFRTV